MRVPVVLRQPQHAAPPIGIGYRLRVPIHHEGRHTEPLLSLGLPARVGVDRLQQCHAMLFYTGHQVVGGDIPGVHNVFGR